MFAPDLANAAWVKSSFSGNGIDCVEVAQGDIWVAMRDSKNPDGPALVLDHAAMSQFLADVKSGAFDLI